MALNPQSGLRDVSGVNDNQKNLIMAFMQGAVYCWVKNRPNEQFAVHDLMGGVNFDWEGTPLQVLYDKHIAEGKDEESATEAAGQDLGWLVKTVLNNDRRTFLVTTGWVKYYRWDGND